MAECIIPEYSLSTNSERLSNTPKATEKKRNLARKSVPKRCTFFIFTIDSGRERFVVVVVLFGGGDGVIEPFVEPRTEVPVFGLGQCLYARIFDHREK